VNQRPQQQQQQQQHVRQPLATIIATAAPKANNEAKEPAAKKIKLRPSWSQ
jgi:hypothetical protein